MKKPDYILGISCFYHDSAVCLLRDGVVVAAAQEERFTRKKHDSSFPSRALAWVLAYARIVIDQVDQVVFYEKPLIKFERLLETYLAVVPRGLRQYIQAMPVWLKQKLWIPDVIRKESGFRGKIIYAGHHESHAASAFFPSPFKEAAFLTMDGVGEWETASFGVGRKNHIEIQEALRFPHSLGLLYSAFTYYAGFRVNSGEYKLMGLAPYGEPRFVDLILKELIDLKEDGSFKLNMKYFAYTSGLRMVNKRFERLFGEPARLPESKMSQHHMDVAASIQRVTEEMMLRIARHVHRQTKMDALCLAGGVALNCVANGRILREGPFKKIWVQPASGDAGAALGAALAGWHLYKGQERLADGPKDSQAGSFLGPEFSDEEIERDLKKAGAAYRVLPRADIPGVVADLIAKENVIGWFQGRMEFGPRALGARSIIGDARSVQMQSKMNLKIKYRESFRPFAPTVLRERVAEWFELDADSPYMLIVAPVAGNRRLSLNAQDRGLTGFDKLKAPRSVIPAVTHVDDSARIQTISREDHPLYYDLISAFNRLTGCPVIINTSFNVRGEPLVCTPEDAFRCFMRTEMDHLCMGSFLLAKTEQKKLERDIAWKKEFALD
jgi:carbamoyltransferase